MAAGVAKKQPPPTYIESPLLGLFRLFGDYVRGDLRVGCIGNDFLGLEFRLRLVRSTSDDLVSISISDSRRAVSSSLVAELRSINSCLAALLVDEASVLVAVDFLVLAAPDVWANLRKEAISRAQATTAIRESRFLERIFFLL